VSTLVWRIGTDAKAYEAHDLSGKGAELSGGRWNRAGTPLVYASTSIALACLETAVHLNTRGLPLNRFLVAIDIPDAVWRAAMVLDKPPIGWSAIPEGRASLDAGQAWIGGAGSAVLIVPSVIVPEEMNVLINPAHRDASGIQARKLRAWFYDARLAPDTGRAN
jgi:RES domain-containing protein